MNFKIKLPVCAAVRDRNELEYISALGQIGKVVRSNGTIMIDDILAFIKSRHGLVVNREDALNCLRDLKGDPWNEDQMEETRGGEEDTFYLDIPMLTSLILIPHLLRISEEKSGTSESNIRDDNPNNSTTENANNHEASKDIFFNGKYDKIYSDDDESRSSSINGENSMLSGDIFDQVLTIIFHDLKLDKNDEPKLTTRLLHQIFRTFGETKVSDDILEQMIQHCQNYESSDNNDDVEGNDYHDIIFNRETFEKALTNDLHAYDCSLEKCQTYMIQDVLNPSQSYITNSTTKIDQSEIGNDNNKLSVENDAMMIEEENTKVEETNLLKKIYNASSIDLSADTFQSEKYFAILLWSLILVYFAYFRGDQYVSSRVNCDEFSFQFGCFVGISILDWLLVFLLACLPWSFVLFVASGVNIDTEKATPLIFAKQIFGILVSVNFFFLPFFNVTLIDGFIGNRNAAFLKWAPYTSFFTGNMLLFIQISQLLRMVYRKKSIWTLSCTLEKEHNSKLAIRHKVHKLCENALALHQYPRGLFWNSQVAISKFESLEYKEDFVGGFWWAYKNYSLLQKEQGIWVSARSVAANASHILTMFTFIFASAFLVNYVQEQYRNDSTTYDPRTFSRSLYFNESGFYAYRIEEIDNNNFLLENNLIFAYNIDDEANFYVESAAENYLRNVVSTIQLTGVLDVMGTDPLMRLRENANELLLNSTGISIDTARTAFEVLRAFEGNFVEFLYNKGQNKIMEGEIISSLIFGAVCGTLVILSITIAFCPNIFLQALEFRHGAFSAPLVDTSFAVLRKAPLNATFFFGGTIWGCLVAGIISASLFGFIFFLIIWRETNKIAVRIITSLIGISITAGLRSLLIFVSKRSTFTAYYRLRPAKANFIVIILESWNIFLAAGEVIARCLKLFLITLLYIGRIDSPLLSPKANIFAGFFLDRYPSIFTADALLHDAHRHPYLDRLGLIYMLKLKHGKRLISKAGSCWRLLFTLVLFPWLRSHRVKTNLIENGL